MAPTVLLTRPQLVATDTLMVLEAKGCRVILAPMLDIKPLVTEEVAKPFDLLFVTSQVVFSVLTQKKKLFDLSCPCYCVGEATAARAREFGFQNIETGDNDALALAQKLAAEMPISTKILYPCALTSTKEGEKFLSQNGYSVEIWPVYSADPIEKLPDSCLSALREGKIDLALFFSRRTGQTFKRLIQTEGLEAACHTMQALALSPAVAEELSELPWQGITIASTPHLESILDLV
ncbi:MAG: uroporphyrinogen-III synthase [Bdellovibrionales bacterium]